MTGYVSFRGIQYDTGTILIGYWYISKNGVSVHPTSSQWRALDSFVFICTWSSLIPI